MPTIEWRAEPDGVAGGRGEIRGRHPSRTASECGGGDRRLMSYVTWKEISIRLNIIFPLRFVLHCIEIPFLAKDTSMQEFSPEDRARVWTWLREQAFPDDGRKGLSSYRIRDILKPHIEGGISQKTVQRAMAVIKSSIDGEKRG